VNLAAVSFPRLREMLGETGLVLPCGPYHVRVRSKLPGIAEGLHRMYADFPVLDQSVFVDFEVAVAAPSLMRSVVRPQAAFYCDGREPFRPVPVSQAFAMLEWGLNWVVSTHAHDHLILHSAVLAKGDRALLLAGDPGAGKSTLCAALMHDGWRLLSDELALVELSSGLLRPLARPVSLKNESIEVIRARAGSECLSAVACGTTKGDVAHVRPDSDSVLQRDRSARPAWLVFPAFSRRPCVARLEAVGRARAMMSMVRHGFNYGLLAGEGFEAMAALVGQCDLFRAEYSMLDEILPQLNALVGCADAPAESCDSNKVAGQVL